MQGAARIEFANTLRGFAALAVMISHYLGFFGPGRDVIAAIINAPSLSLDRQPIPISMEWFFNIPAVSLGAFGVALFFIISGFVIPFSLQNLNWLGFSASRFFRIVPTYVAGFSVTLLAVFVSSTYFSNAWPYSPLEVLVHYVPGIRDVLWSRHIDFIVWTLEIEMKFYFVCAALAVWFRRYSLKVFLLPVVLFVLSLYLDRLVPGWLTTHPFAYRLGMTVILSSQYLIFMFIGVAIHYLYRGKIDRVRAGVFVAALFALFCTHWWVGPYSAGFGVARSYAAALLTFGVACACPRIFNGNRVFDFLADISYPLYVIHGVAGYVALRILLDKGVGPWPSLFVVTVGCLVASSLLHVLVERPSQALGKRLAAGLGSARFCIPVGAQRT
jgi:peptidoglycan/LPS O-acetylase OafA/YrhL